MQRSLFRVPAMAAVLATLPARAYADVAPRLPYSVPDPEASARELAATFGAVGFVAVAAGMSIWGLTHLARRRKADRLAASGGDGSVDALPDRDRGDADGA